MKLSNLIISSQGIYFQDKDNRRLSFQDSMSKIINRFRNYYLDFELFFLNIVGHVPSHLFRNFIYRSAGIQLGRRATLHMGARFFEPKNISIGEGSIIGDHVFLDGRAKLEIGKEVDIASQVLIYNSEHDLDSPSMAAREEPVEIGDYVFVGPRAIILPGVKIGQGAVVAAGAVVTKNIPDFAIVGGIPAKIIGTRSNKDLHYRLGRARLFQ